MYDGMIDSFSRGISRLRKEEQAIAWVYFVDTKGIGKLHETMIPGRQCICSTSIVSSEDIAPYVSFRCQPLFLL
jgi:hypothetical protein